MTNIVGINNQVSTGFNSSQVELIKNTVAKGATADELNMFMYLANQYNLDPFKKEIWFMKFGGQTTIMTSRDGYLKYAQMNEDFEGLMSFVVREGDVFEIDASEYKVTHKFGANRGPILGAWSRCDRKGKKPFIAYVEFNEYNKNTSIWKSYPSAMIQKVAEVFVLKRAFGINGLVTKEEIDNGEEKEEINISEHQAKALFSLAKNDLEIVRQVLDEFGFEGSLDITKFMYEDVCERTRQLVAAKKAETDAEMDDVIDEVDIETGEIQSDMNDVDFSDTPFGEDTPF
ncbi:phage recombination protein Bet [Tissierella sp.]|uniref:phage recombination protein Bet n=1 Tax=Tissierella sp. TaxID=41274 RepID=UPI0028558A82|nr:phage recombination protein Bet [Tissierella sp.]MDR7856331.1 phage recombination protein Bet [Tissierella sp.]